VKATPLLLIGLGVCAALRCGLWNVGADGQFCLGAVAGTWAAVALPETLGPLRWALVTLAAVTGGGLWGAAAGALRAWRNANEIIVTVMLNYVAYFLLSYLIRGPLREPGNYLPVSAELPAALTLPVLVEGTRLHLGFPISLLLAGVMSAAFRFMTVGVRAKAVGLAPEVAQACGIRVAWVQCGSFVVAGGLAGFAGWTEVAGVHHRLIEHITPGYGFAGLALAVLGGGRPLPTTLVAILFAALLVGADEAQRSIGIPSSLASAVIGVFLLAFASAEGIRRRILQKRRLSPSV
jgi:simple sugar transport system permease protein